jgi:ferredoxin
MTNRLQYAQAPLGAACGGAAACAECAVGAAFPFFTGK